MRISTTNSTKQLFRWGIGILGSLLLVGVGLYVYVKIHARELLLSYANEKTNHSYTITLSDTEIDFWNASIHIKALEFKEKERKVNRSSIEYLSIPNIVIEVGSMVSLFHKRILIKRVTTESPRVVYRIHPKKNTAHTESLTQTFGYIFLTLEKILVDLKIDDAELLDADITIHYFNKHKTIEQSFKDINLTLKDFQLKDAARHILSSGDVSLWTQRQRYLSPDSTTQVQVSGLSISTTRKKVAIENVHFRHVHPTGAIRSIALDIPYIRFHNIDFLALYERDHLQVDSILLMDSSIEIDFFNQQKKKVSQKVSLDTQLKEAWTSCAIQYIGLLNAKIQLNTSFQKVLNEIQVHRNDIQIWNVLKKREELFTLDSILITVDNYRRFTSDSLYIATLGSVSINKNQFILNDYHLQPTHSVHDKNLLHLKTDKLILNQPDYYQLLEKNEVSVTDVLLVSPTIHYTQNIHRKTKKKKGETVLKEIWNRADLNSLQIINGSIVIDSKVHKNEIQLSHLNTTLNFKERIDTSLFALLYHCKNISVEKAQYKDSKQKLLFHHVNYLQSNHTLRVGQLSFTDSSTAATMDSISLLHLYVDNEIIKSSLMSWGKADVSIQSKQLSPSNSKKHNTNTWTILLDSIVGNKNTIQFTNKQKGITVDTYISSIGIQKASIDSALQWSKASAVLQRTFFKNPSTQLQFSSAVVHDKQPSQLKNIEVENINTAFSQKTGIDSIDFTCDWKKCIQDRRVDVEDIRLYQPKVSMTLSSPAAKKETAAASNPPDILLKNVSCTNGSMHLIQKDKLTSNTIHLDSIDIEFNELQFLKHNVSLQYFSLVSKLKTFSIHDSIEVKARDKIMCSIRSLKKDSKIKLDIASFFIPIQHIKALLPNANEFEWGAFDVQLRNQLFYLDKKFNWKDFVRSGPDLELQRINTQLNTKDGVFRFHNIYLNIGKEKIEADSITFHPKHLLSSFREIYPYQKDYINLRVGKIKCSGINFKTIVDEKTLIGKKIFIQNLQLSSIRDKQLAASPIVPKTLLFGLLQKIKLPFYFQSFEVFNSRVSYTEYSSSGKQGTVSFEQLAATVQPFTNDATLTDTLYLKCSASLLNKAPVRIHYRESTIDTLSGFKYRLFVGKMNMTHLNQVVTPLSNIVIKSGTIDTLIIRASGNKNYCYGTIQFFFDKLKININAASDESIINPLLDIASLYANTLLLRTRNTDRTDKVYFERIPHKSIFNYWFKISLSGIMTGIGLKHDKNYQKKYEQYISTQQDLN